MLKLDKSKNTGIIFIYDLVGYEFKINKREQKCKRGDEKICIRCAFEKN